MNIYFECCCFSRVKGPNTVRHILALPLMEFQFHIRFQRILVKFSNIHEIFKPRDSQKQYSATHTRESLECNNYISAKPSVPCLHKSVKTQNAIIHIVCPTDTHNCVQLSLSMHVNMFISTHSHIHCVCF